MHAGGGTNDRGEKRNVLIVSVLLLIGSYLTLRSNTQRRIQILRVRQAPVLLHVAGRPKPVMGDAEVKDQRFGSSSHPQPRETGNGRMTVVSVCMCVSVCVCARVLSGEFVPLFLMVPNCVCLD